MQKNGECRVLLIYANLMLQAMFPLGLASLSAVLKRAGHKVQIFDTTFYETDEVTPDEYRVRSLQIRPYDTKKHREPLKPLAAMISDLRQKIDEFTPHLIGVSTTEDCFGLTLDVLRAIEDYGIPNVVGGVLPTFAPERVIREKAVDMVCIGEGEGPLLELAEAIVSGQDPTRIQNLWVKRKKSGWVAKNPIRPVLELDELPIPDFTLFDQHRQLYPTSKGLLLMGPVETHRGCPYRCSFCNSPAQQDLYKDARAGSFFRLKSIQRVREELLFLKQTYAFESLSYVADTFLAMPRTYLEEFAEISQDIGLPFWCQTRPETLTDETVALLEKAGCSDISIGLEHGNEEFRRRVIQRDYSNDTLIKSFESFRSSSIYVKVNNIVGYPTETRDLSWDTLRLNRRIAHRFDTANCFHFVPYRGTELRKMCMELGYITEETETCHNYKDTVVEMPQFSKDAIRGAVRTFNLYLRFPESEIARIRVAERMDDVGNAAFEELREEFNTKYMGSRRPTAVSP